MLDHFNFFLYSGFKGGSVSLNVIIEPGNVIEKNIPEKNCLSEFGYAVKKTFKTCQGSLFFKMSMHINKPDV